MNLLGSMSQVSLLDGIVPFPHLLGLMANKFHNCRCIHPCASEMSRSTVAHAIKPEVRDTSLLEGRIERPAAAGRVLTHRNSAAVVIKWLRPPSRVPRPEVPSPSPLAPALVDLQPAPTFP